MQNYSKTITRSTFILIILIIILSNTACAQPGEITTPTQTSKIETTQTATATHTSTPTATIEPTSTPTQTSAPEQKTLWISSSADIFNRVISVDPGNQQRIAYCSDDGIQISADGGETWEVIPTSGVAVAAKQVGYQVFDNNPAVSNACMNVSLDSSHPDSYYAVFTMAHEDYGAPPIFYIGFYTVDNGTSWQPIAPPKDSNFESFGGIWTDAEGQVEVLFAKPKDLVDSAEPVNVQESNDGGVTWKAGTLSCPAEGPCLRWGPATSVIPGMGSPLPQEIFISLDEGETWQTVDPAVELRADPPNQLAAFSKSEAEIISGSIFLSMIDSPPQPLRITRDGGNVWQAKNLPKLLPTTISSDYFPGLQILPDGSYLTQSGEGNSWFWFSTTSEAWCEVNSNALPLYPTLLKVVGDQLWWVDSETGLAVFIHLTDISCVDNGQ
jgi:hypothetical protein